MNLRRALRATRAGSLPAPQLTWAYLFDIDGTLVDIAAVPNDVRIAPEMRAIIDQLHKATGGAVALISGRSIDDIDHLYPRSRIPLSGQHGVEARDAHGVSRSPTFDREVLQHARERLAGAVARHAGLMLQDKGHSLALHYRGAPRLASYAHHLMHSIQSEVGGAFVVQAGKRIVELRPASTDKGLAVMEVMRQPPFAGRTPVFVGDDVTDEYAFAAVNNLGGHSVKVGKGTTVAQWRLRDIAELMTWLKRTT